MVQLAFAGTSSRSPCQCETQAAFPARGRHGQECWAEGWSGRSLFKPLLIEWGFRAEPYVAFQREEKQNPTKAT